MVAPIATKATCTQIDTFRCTLDSPLCAAIGNIKWSYNSALNLESEFKTSYSRLQETDCFS